jgi:hypothetical protein
LAVPEHLRSSGGGRRRYLYPHDFAGDDVDQQYMPDGLAGRHYYFPGGQGAEIKIRERLARLAEARAEPRRRKTPIPGQPESDPMSAGSEGMRRRRQNLREMADDQRDDADG